jgi:hypothetical protein
VSLTAPSVPRQIGAADVASEPVRSPVPPIKPEDEDAAQRRVLLAKLVDDRKDLVRVAGAVRELAETFEVAQSSLAMLRRSLRWLALLGGVAALTASMRSGRRPPVLLLTGLSLYLAQRWLSHPVRDGLATSAHPVWVGSARAAARPPLAPSRRPALAPAPARPRAV